MTLLNKLTHKFPHIPPGVLRLLILKARKHSAADFDVYSTVTPIAIKLNALHEVKELLLTKLQFEAIMKSEHEHVLLEKMKTLINEEIKLITDDFINSL